ncbi:MAG: cupin [Hydrogenimonas sp.]|nr:MAG: cupin [Hydrogenimonas sp.]
MKNLFEYAVPTHGEWFKTLLQNDNVTIEVIVSSDTPEPKVYNQPHDEAVLLIDGEATLELQGQEITMRPGDFLHIPAHTPHRVLKTAKGSRWLAIHTKEALC